MVMEASLLVSASALTITCILLSHPHSILSLNHGNSPPDYTAGDVSLNCGSKWNSTALDGREWTGESAPKSISGQSTTSVSVATSFLGADPVPYMTSRISSSPFHFTFQVSPGQKFIRLHFYPALYRGFEKSLALFSVKAGPFTLLSDFSPAHVSCSNPLGVKYIVKEFCLNVEQQGKLRIAFSPSQGHMVYAFVNGIEIVSMPTGLYYTPDGDAGAPVVGQNNRYHGIDNRTALEMVQRLNIGGSYISSVADFSLFRRWNADADYFLESKECMMSYRAPQLAAYTNLPLLIAPPKLFHTSWKTTHQLNSFTWRIPVAVGFGYLVRLHFCDLDAAMTDGEQTEFIILIDNQIAETHSGVTSIGFPVYRDYVVMVKGEKQGSECDLFIVLRSQNGLSLELLKGIEIFRLSNLENSLATSSSIPAVLNKVSTNWNLKVEKGFFSPFSRSNVMGTGMLVIILIVNIVFFYLRIIQEESSQNIVNDAVVEQSPHRFSLADIKSATLNFSDAFVIGRGGFGNVYKGLICGFPEIVAIKRLSSMSRQGAREFRAEIEILSKLRHFNLVSLFGYCDENEEMILVYEYISGGTLAENLYKFARKGKDSTLLSWKDRLRICIGAARGLEYLHTGSQTGIIHRDVKASNILLDENLVPKISDFGLSKVEESTQAQSYISTKVKGTHGYLDPYYCSTSRLTKKSDVYSFGIVMLVVLSGRPANPGEPSLPACFQECLSKQEFERIVDPNISSNISPGSLREFVSCVESCLQKNPKNRPTMAQMVSCLEKALQLQQKPIVQHSKVETIQSGEMSTVATLEESVASPPGKELTRNKVSNLIRKPFWIWPWKMGHSRGEIFKAEEPPLYKFETVASATDKFDPRNLIGQGGFGRVYKGRLFNGQAIAVKMLSNSSGQGIMQFMNEITIISKLQHRNLVRILGGCDEKGKKMILYEYMPNKSLDKYLFDLQKQDFLDWNRRLIIIEGIIRGLIYLHRDSRLRIIHRDIKASNILLDEHLNPKISDFGLAKIFEASQDEDSTTQLAGTLGYIAPEYVWQRKCSEKSDVFSFGMLLLEIVSGKSIHNHSLYNGEGHAWLPEYAWKMWNENQTVRLAFTEIHDPSVGLEIKRCIQVGLLCVQNSPNDRPNMSNVLSMLNNDITELPLPKMPAYSTPHLEQSNLTNSGATVTNFHDDDVQKV